MSGTALERNFKTLLQIVRQRTRLVRRREHEVPLRREHRNSIRSRHFINGSSPITLGVALYVVDALRTTVVRTRRCNTAGYLSRLAWMRSWSSLYF